MTGARRRFNFAVVPDSLSARLAIGFLLFVAALAVWKGRWPERTIGIALVVHEVAYLSLYRPSDSTFTQWPVFALDIALFAVLAFVAIRSDRTWAKYAAAITLLGVATHLAFTIDLRIEAVFAFWMGAFCALALHWLLLAGTLQVIWQARRARAAAGAEPVR